MKKFFLFAAAAVAALSVNAKVITFGDIVDNTEEAKAMSSFQAAFSYQNIDLKANQNSDKTAWLVEIYQKTATTDWETTSLSLKADDQVYFAFKDGSDNKFVMKAYKEYLQPNGKAVCMVITGLKKDDKVKINLKKALSKETFIEGATVTKDNFASESVELTATGDKISVYSKSEDGKSDAKWQVVSVEVPDAGDQAIENVNADVKSVKTFENGQLVIIKNGVRYNALGAQL